MASSTKEFNKLIFIDSSPLEGENSAEQGISGTHANLTLYFDRPIDIPAGCRVGLDSASVWYTWPILADEKSNNYIAISNDNGASYTAFQIPDGTYDIDGFDAVITSILVDTYGEDAKAPPIALLPNFNTSQVEIAVAAPYRLNIGDSGVGLGLDGGQGLLFYKFLGWTDEQAKIITTDTIGDTTADVTFGENSYQIHCSLVNSSVYNRHTSNDIIAGFVPNEAPGSLLHIRNSENIHIRIENMTRITFINMRITDQRNRLLKLREPVAYTLHLKTGVD